MKKQIALAMGLAVISGSAFASKARLQALGESTDGSQYISDNRNIFLNAAHVNYHKDMVTFEAGSQSNNDDNAAEPNAEGGFLKAHNNMVYGVYFGATAGRNAADRPSTRTAAPQFVDGEMNVWDFFVGGDAGVQWGANLTYGEYKDETQTNEEEASLLRARLGVISGDIEGFANISLTDTEKVDTTSDFEMKSNYDLGGSYNQGDMTYLARVMSWEAEDGDRGSESIKYQGVTVGAARLQKFNNMATMNYKITYNTITQEGTDYTDTDETKYMSVNAVIGVEVQVKEWLALRASIVQDIINETENDGGDKITNSDSTAVFAGASLVFGDLQIDGLIGNDADGNIENDGTAPDTVGDTSSGNGVLRSDALMTRLSATYRF